MKSTNLLGGLLALGALSAPLAAQTSVHILAEIDGRSRLTLVGDTAQWQHFDLAAPGRLSCMSTKIEPTVVNGHGWWPTWPDLPDCENRDCLGCTSDVLTGIAPALPLADFEPLLNPLSVRGTVAIVEYPTVANGYRVVIEFNDNLLLGAEWYEIEISVLDCGTYTRYCTSTPNSTGLPAKIDLAGSLSVAVNDMHLLAFQCPPELPGLFIYGTTPMQIPFADGYLCISPYFPGLYRAGPPQFLSPSGATNLQLDLTSMPGGAGILPDSTWHFQFWYRDHAAGNSGSNLSDALAVTFCP